MQTSLDTNIAEFSEIVDWIYQGATDVEEWPKISKKICDWLGAKTCVIFTPQFPADQGGFAIKHQFDGMLELYDAKYNAHNIWEMRAYERGLLTTGSVVRDQDLVTDQEFLDSIFYKEYMSPVNLGRMIAGIVFDPRDNDGKAVVCACHKPFDKPFSTSDSEKLQLLMPHLSRSLGVMFKLRDAEFKVANCLRSLNCLNRGVLLFNALGEVCHANDCAKELLELNDGLRLKPSKNIGHWHLYTTSARMQSILETAISESVGPDVLTTRHFSNALNIERPSGKASFTLCFSTLGDQHEFHSPTSHACAIAFILDLSKPITLKSDLLKTTYDLTKTELKVANLLANGHALKSAGQILEVTPNTVKSHLKQIHIKTNTNNRAKLVKLLMTLSDD